MLSRTIDAVHSLEDPRNLSELQEFLGLCNVSPPFIPSFASVAAGPNRKLQRWELQTFDSLSEEETTASETLEAKSKTLPLLALPQLQGDHIVHTDDSYKQTGCVLQQKQPDGTDRPFVYWYCSVTDTEKAYDTSHCKCLAVV